MPGAMELRRELDVAIDLARRAGLEILTFYDTPTNIEWKDAREPVTVADKAANGLIVEGLAIAFPEDAILAEEPGGEAVHGHERFSQDRAGGDIPYLEVAFRTVLSRAVERAQPFSVLTDAELEIVSRLGGGMRHRFANRFPILRAVARHRPSAVHDETLRAIGGERGGAGYVLIRARRQWDRRDPFTIGNVEHDGLLFGEDNESGAIRRK